MRPSALPALLLGLSTFAAATRAADGPEEAAHIARLVGQLGSSSFEQRQEAARALDAVGGPALAALRAAERGPDPEVRRRARDLVRRIERREETARVLRPQRLRLVYKDTPLGEALADFSRKTGARIQLSGNGAAAKRRVTLDTGETTYWGALALFCAAAGLHEPDHPASAVGREEVFARGGGGRRILFLDRRRTPQAPENTVVLADGKVSAGPACLVGALRVRLLLPPNALTRPEGASGDLPLTIDVQPEPRFGWESLTLLRIDRALDDRGRELQRPAPHVGGLENATDPVEEVILVTDGELNLPANQGQRRVTLPLRLGGRPCPRLRELRGSVAAWVRAPAEPLVEVAGVMKAKGRSVRGRDGTVLKVTNVESEADGLCRLQVMVTPPPPVSDLVPPGARVRWIDRNTRGRVLLDPKAADQPFALIDEGGRPLTLAAGEYVVDRDGAARSSTLTFRPAPDRPRVGPAARLVYKGRRTAFVEVPFVFKDVELTKPAPR
ncbi:MAG TPA: hypothetical protein VFE78_39560 [Gemmataceae bacterium]|nr:hypothetical protein [Gemmataceae bacterium]